MTLIKQNRIFYRWQHTKLRVVEVEPGIGQEQMVPTSDWIYDSTQGVSWDRVHNLLRLTHKGWDDFSDALVEQVKPEDLPQEFRVRRLKQLQNEMATIQEEMDLLGASAVATAWTQRLSSIT